MREPERLDLSALDPRRDHERWEQMVHQIMWRSTGELQRRQGSAVFGLFDGLVAWSRPALTAAAALAALSLVAVSQFRTPNVVTQATYFQSGLAFLGVVGGALIGIIGSAVSVGRHLRRV